MSNRWFPIMPLLQDRGLISEARRAGTPFVVIAIPWAMIAPHEAQARSNHGQSLTGLANRGGLCSSEAMAVLEDRSWYKSRLTEVEANNQLAVLTAAWIVKHAEE